MQPPRFGPPSSTLDPRPLPPLQDPSLLTSYGARRENLGFHLALFLATLLACVFVGGLWAARSELWTAEGGLLPLLQDPVFLRDGFAYAVPLLLFLTAHEFGHYIAARLHRIDVSLPYYIPAPIPGFLGTFGAVIRIREPLRRTRDLFDVGAAGPLAGFVVALGVLAYALATLPDPGYVFDLGGHEALKETLRASGTFPAVAPPTPDGLPALHFGRTPLFALFAALSPHTPPPYEIYHYPVLFAGWIALLFTALNLLPVGQLDGGHVVYALFGPRVHRVVARIATAALLFSGLLGGLESAAVALAEVPGTAWAWNALVWVVAALVAVGAMWKILDLAPRFRLAGGALVIGLVAVAYALGLETTLGFSGWLLWVGLILFVIRIDHPPVLKPEPLTPGRKALAWVCVAIFVLSFSIRPIYMV